MVIWLIGLSGSGKSTLANKIVKEANKIKHDTILLDGDMVREVFGNDLGYSIEDRLKNAERFCQLGKFLDSQGFNVVAAILSLFPENRDWNRKNIKHYYEVFIDTPIDLLVERDSKGIYAKFNKGEISDVAGLDINFPIPKRANLVIKNNGSKDSLLNYATQIIEKLHPVK
ncbi:adenylyl-sulfate kinase [Methylophilaceae bacterium Uisw_099_01]